MRCTEVALCLGLTQASIHLKTLLTRLPQSVPLPLLLLIHTAAAAAAARGEIIGIFSEQTLKIREWYITSDSSSPVLQRLIRALFSPLVHKCLGKGLWSREAPLDNPERARLLKMLLTSAWVEKKLYKHPLSVLSAVYSLTMGCLSCQCPHQRSFSTVIWVIPTPKYRPQNNVQHQELFWRLNCSQKHQKVGFVNIIRCV